MATAKQMHYLATHPAAHARFAATGQLPKFLMPSSALITLLEAIGPRERSGIRYLRVGPDLGYEGRRVFENAAVALRWLKPDVEIREGTWPAESWRIKAFSRTLQIEDLVRHASTTPANLSKLYPMLCHRLPSKDDELPVEGASDVPRPTGG